MVFPPTNWKLLEDATLSGDEVGRAALARLYTTYRAPVMSFLAMKGIPEDEREDVAQDFFVKLLSSRLWRRADPERGKFRTFLLGVLNNLLLHRVRDQQRLKRGGETEPESLDWLEEQGEMVPAPQDEVSERFDTEWARTIVNHAVAVAAERVTRGDKAYFAVLRRFLPGAHTLITYEQAAQETGMSVVALRTAVYRFREDFRNALRAEVARTVSAPHEINEELRYLGSLLNKSVGL